MSNRIGLVTDSSSQITAELVERFSIEVVPLTITIDGVEHSESPDGLDADGFYEHFTGGATPEITTSQPSPAAFVEAYRRLSDAGCDQIVSIHISEAMSGTVNSATLAARSVDVPVEVVDTSSASFGVAICVWAAGVARGVGVDAAGIRERIEAVAADLGTAFMVGVPLLTERSGRAEGVEFDGDGIAVLAMRGGDLEVLDRVSTIEDTVDVMAAYATASGPGVTVAIGTADAPSRPLTDRLEAALGGLDGVDQVVHYRVGPSVGAHTGPGTFGLFTIPTSRLSG